jgi:hypothetical protein
MRAAAALTRPVTWTVTVAAGVSARVIWVS